MTRYREHKEVYTRDFSRWSVYPKTPKPEEYSVNNVKPGAVFTVEIRDIDEKGRGVAFIRNYKVRINGGGTVGDKVKIRILRAGRDDALAEIIEWL
jgi:predicted RNA-binding protein with TRAM domain